MRLSPRRSPAVWLTVCSALLAGCGSSGGPKLAHADGASLIALVHRIADEGADGRARDIPMLSERAIGLVNARKVPAKLQEPLLSMVNAVGVQPGAARRLEDWLRRYSR
jgi:hypothetical protein